MRSSTIARYIALTLLLAACGASERAGTGEGLRLVELESVRLQESDSLVLATPGFLASDADGSLFVSDVTSGTVLQFDARGELLRRFGSPGGGPGELRNPLPLALVGDSLLAISDLGTSRTSLFDRRTGGFVRWVRHEGIPFSMQSAGDTVWLSDVHPLRQTSLAVWPAAEDSVRYLGPLPAEYLQAPHLMEAHPYATLARLEGDRILLGFTGHHALFVTRPDGVVLDTVEVPVLHRRGVPHDLAQRFSQELRNDEVASMVSALVGLHPLSSGDVAVVYLDIVLQGTVPTAQGFLSVLSADLRRGCVDAPIAFAQEGRPLIAFRGDTLLALEQRVTEAAEGEAIVRRFTLDTTGCSWAPAR